MSMFYSSHGDKAWAVKFVAAKRNNFWTKSSFSASIEGDALVSWHWFSIRFQSELAALGFELLFKRPSPFPLFGAAAMVGLLNIYKKLLRDSFVSRSVNALVLVWQNEACSGSWQTLLPSFLLCLLLCVKPWYWFKFKIQLHLYYYSSFKVGLVPEKLRPCGTWSLADYTHNLV